MIDSKADASALCTSCGLCCDGTLFGSVLVDPAESARLERIGLPILRGEAPTLPQPCTALSGCRCSVYEERPSACARYECALHRDVSAGAQSLDEALATVTKARSLLTTIRASLEIDEASSIWQAIAAIEAPASIEEERAWAEAHAGALASLAALVPLIRAKIEPRFAGGGAR